MSQLLNSNFISEFTDFSSLTEMIAHTDFPVKVLDELDETPKHFLDAFIQKHSEFSTWDEMVGNAKCYLVSEEYGLD